MTTLNGKDICDFYERGKVGVVEGLNRIVLECINESNYPAIILPVDCFVSIQQRDDKFFNVTCRGSSIASSSHRFEGEEFEFNRARSYRA